MGINLQKQRNNFGWNSKLDQTSLGIFISLIITSFQNNYPKDDDLVMEIFEILILFSFKNYKF